MVTLVTAVFVASLLGSLHCAGMCGAFLAIACGDGAAPKSKTQAAYHLGRLVTYVSLGAIAGAVGGAMDVASGLAGVQPVAMGLAGVTLVAFGVTALARLRGVALFARPPGVLLRWSARGHRAAMAYPPVARAGMIGLLTTLLPCGWLYAFLAPAAGTASPLRAAAVMGVFWVGTLPMLVALGAGLRGLLGPVAARMPAVTAVALVGMGVWTLAGRSAMSPGGLMGRVEGEGRGHANTALRADHGRDARDTGGASGTRGVPSAASRPVCCEVEEKP